MKRFINFHQDTGGDSYMQMKFMRIYRHRNAKNPSYYVNVSKQVKLQTYF